MDEIGRNYLTLALNIDRHFEGVVDAYYGPPELKAEVEQGEPRALDALADDAGQLEAAIDASDFDAQRKDYLTRQTRAMAAIIRNLSGDQLDFVEEVELYFDITPQMVDEAVFEGAHAEIDRLLPGDGSLRERVIAWEKSVELEPDLVGPVFNLALQESRRRTQALFGLPPGEEVSLDLVEDKPWRAYNRYLGGHRSRIELNTDVPARLYATMSVVTHEAYPGHHTEHAIKEYRLYRQQGRAEHAIHVLGPEAVLAEGIAVSALGIIFSDEELAAFLRDELCPLGGLPDVDTERLIGMARALRTLRTVVDNAALLLHRDGRSVDEVQKYIEGYYLSEEKHVAQAMQFIQIPLWRSYAFNYTVGEELLAPLLEGPDDVANFRRLLSEPFTPTRVRQWVEERRGDTKT
ncbi:MAG: hypothetical protein GTO63_18210 [Anaerolineae bacterium]|nr:hypothetical protein [Anaerolineae bacterium]NIN96705.1 hypothetical protein [Anaerolineae bacterium]NIQ79716.1 hypothetical protein [Anaerolineae bacterium]